MNIGRVCIASIFFAAVLSGGPVMEATCTNASLTGVYGVTSGGLNGSAQPAASLDQITADGKGNFTGSSTKSINGTIVTFTFTGTYKVAGNCTGSATFTNQSGMTEHDNFVLDNANKGAFLIQTDNNHIQSSIAVAQGTATCTDLGVKHIYATEATGMVLAGGQIAFVGQLALNGTGSLTGTASLSLNGVITSSVPVTGTYKINSNCTGNAAITPQGQSTMNLNIVVVNGGKELMFIQTDTNTIVTGAMQM